MEFVNIGRIQRRLAFSTNTPIGASSMYTSPWVDATNYKTINISMFTDVQSQYSTEYTDDFVVIIGLALSRLSASTFNGQDLVCYRRYIRLKIVTDTTPQGSLSVSGWLSPL